VRRPPSAPNRKLKEMMKSKSKKSKKFETEIPWGNSRHWREGEWYPMPFGFMARNNPGYIIEGYGIYRLEGPDAVAPEEDVYPVTTDSLPFSAALEICEAHNGRTMIEK
jgi:hypothetical protein